ncbi:hypothetical protein BS50DRAFT_592280 [Corynespora cassiicola Philippines]|uniref:Uncharacterized protein n=1 Tax=Corynespora cassiicola Philippines TaxID=1448308 RepID=A0A2T2N9X9_CORCC|nr:hypothetical protein BS50DRAFT_592280 [Corynespora cassiicola Philippines]
MLTTAPHPPGGLPANSAPNSRRDRHRQAVPKHARAASLALSHSTGPLRKSQTAHRELWSARGSHPPMLFRGTLALDAVKSHASLAWALRDSASEAAETLFVFHAFAHAFFPRYEALWNLGGEFGAEAVGSSDGGCEGGLLSGMDISEWAEGLRAGFWSSWVSAGLEIGFGLNVSG